MLTRLQRQFPHVRFVTPEDRDSPSSSASSSSVESTFTDQTVPSAHFVQSSFLDINVRSVQWASSSSSSSSSSANRDPFPSNSNISQEPSTASSPPSESRSTASSSSSFSQTPPGPAAPIISRPVDWLLCDVVSTPEQVCVSGCYSANFTFRLLHSFETGL